MCSSGIPFIIVTGVDGSGKTTIAKFLVAHLKTRGYRTKGVWIKSLHTLAYIISLVLGRGEYGHFAENPGGVVITRFQPADYKSLGRLWSLVEFISVLPWIILKVYLPIFFGSTIVADRYVVDTVVMISTNVKDMFFADKFLGRLLLKMIPKGAIIFHMDADFDTLIERRPDIEYTRAEIETQMKLYRMLAVRLNAYTVNTSNLGIEETMKEVLERIPCEQMDVR